MRIALVDQGKIPKGLTAYESVQSTLRAASAAEQAGYYRYWVAEHHGAGAVCGSPDVLLGAITQRTSAIRIGAGVALLPYYNPHRIATSYRLLDYLAPGRIDLGLGRGRGATAEVSSKLHPNDASFPEQLRDLLRAVTSLREGGYQSAEFVDVWLTGSRLASSSWAATLKLPYCFLFTGNIDLVVRAAATYRSTPGASLFAVAIPLDSTELSEVAGVSPAALASSMVSRLNSMWTILTDLDLDELFLVAPSTSASLIAALPYLYELVLRKAVTR